MTADLDHIALRLIGAVVFGALIGTERQLRHRMAGVRTNALVALGAASFVTFSSLFPGEPSQTRVAAQVVSGIGFLGAGVIFRDGLTLHGLNTAATLWCAAAVGMMCGAAALDIAALLTTILLAINLGLRPLVNWVDAHLLAGLRAQRVYRIAVTGLPVQEAVLREAFLDRLRQAGAQLSAMETHLAPDGEALELAATVTGNGIDDAVMERAVELLAGAPAVLRVGWQAVDAV